VRLGQERALKGWTREYVAEQVGAEVGTIGRWERGEYLPHPYYRQKLCTLFAKTPQELGLLPEASDENEVQVGEVSPSQVEKGPQEPVDFQGQSSPVWFSRRTALTIVGGLTGVSLLSSGFIAAGGLFFQRRVRQIGKPLAGPSFDRFNNLSWSPNQRYLAMATDAGSITVWDVSQLEHPKSLKTFSAPPHLYVNEVSWSSDSSLLAAACANKYTDGQLNLWNVAEGRPEELPAPQSGPLITVAWSPKEEILAYGGRIKTIELLDRRDPSHPRSFDPHRGEVVNCMRWSPDGTLLASGDDEGNVFLWNVRTGVVSNTYTGHVKAIRDISWSPDGKLLATAGYDATVQIWEAHTAHQLFVYRGHAPFSVHAVSWSTHGNFLVSGGEDQTVRLWHWDETGGQEITSLDKHASFVHAIAWRPGSLIAAVGFQHEGIEIWELLPS